MTLEERILKIINKIEYSDDGEGRIDTWGHTKVVQELAELVRIEVGNAFDAGEKYKTFIVENWDDNGEGDQINISKQKYLNQLK